MGSFSLKWRWETKMTLPRNKVHVTEIVGFSLKYESPAKTRPAAWIDTSPNFEFQQLSLGSCNTHTNCSWNLMSVLSVMDRWRYLRSIWSWLTKMTAVVQWENVQQTTFDGLSRAYNGLQWNAVIWRMEIWGGLGFGNPGGFGIWRPGMFGGWCCLA